MKTLLLKSFLFFVLGGALVSGAGTANKGTSPYIFHSDGVIEDSVGVEAKDYDEKEFNSCKKQPFDTAKEVYLDTALSMIAEFQLWQRMVPRYFRVKGDSIHFYPIKVDSADLIAIEKFAELFYNASDGIHPTRKMAKAPLEILPFSTPHGMVRSYFIPRADLDTLLSSNTGTRDGVRVHLAAKNVSALDPDTVSSHLLVTYAAGATSSSWTPSTKIYDLTMPCPSACDPSSELNEVGPNKIIYPELKKTPVK